MITPPQIDKSNLKKTVESIYEITISRMSFVPGGETSWGYKVEAGNNTYFLKLYKNKPQFLEKAAELTYTLYSQCHITEIVHAIKAKNGKAVNMFEKYPFVLYNYIAGKEVAEQKPTDTQNEEMGRILGRIHNATSVIGAYPKKETFESKDKKAFLRVLERIKLPESDENTYQKQVIDLLMPLEKRIMLEWESFEHLKQILIEKNLPFVMCHSDPTQGNILIDTEGKLYLIDWDTPLLAPKERDLVFFSHCKEPFMKGYTEIVGQITIDEDAKQFYLLEWNIQEVADLGSKLLFEANSEEQNKHDLAELIHFLDYSGIAKKRKTRRKLIFN